MSSSRLSPTRTTEVLQLPPSTSTTTLHRRRSSTKPKHSASTIMANIWTLMGLRCRVVGGETARFNIIPCWRRLKHDIPRQLVFRRRRRNCPPAPARPRSSRLRGSRAPQQESRTPTMSFAARRPAWPSSRPWQGPQHALKPSRTRSRANKPPALRAVVRMLVLVRNPFFSSPSTARASV